MLLGSQRSCWRAGSWSPESRELATAALRSRGSRGGFSRVAWFSGTCFSLGEGLCLKSWAEGGGPSSTALRLGDAVRPLREGGPRGLEASGSSPCPKQSRCGKQPYTREGRNGAPGSVHPAPQKWGCTWGGSVLSRARGRRQQLDTGRVSSPGPLPAPSGCDRCEPAAEGRECTVEALPLGCCITPPSNLGAGASTIRSRPSACFP